MKIEYTNFIDCPRSLTNTNLEGNTTFRQSKIHSNTAQLHSSNTWICGNIQRWAGKDLQCHSKADTALLQNVSKSAESSMFLTFTFEKGDKT